MPRCVTTNPQPQNDRLTAALRAEGVSVVQWPLHAVVRIAESAVVQAALGSTDWVIVVSQYAIPALQHVRLPSNVRVVALGAATAAALHAAGIVTQLYGDGGGMELAKRLCQHQLCDTRVSILQAEDGRTDWHAHLRAAGAVITVVLTHRLVPVATHVAHYETLNAGDAMLFTAPSAVRRFVKICPRTPSVKCFAIGSTTAAAMHNVGLPCAGVSPVPEFSAFAKYVAIRLRERAP